MNRKKLKSSDPVSNRDNVKLDRKIGTWGSRVVPGDSTSFVPFNDKDLSDQLISLHCLEDLYNIFTRVGVKRFQIAVNEAFIRVISDAPKDPRDRRFKIDLALISIPKDVLAILYAQKEHEKYHLSICPHLAHKELIIGPVPIQEVKAFSILKSKRDLYKDLMSARWLQSPWDYFGQDPKEHQEPRQEKKGTAKDFNKNDVKLKNTKIKPLSKEKLQSISKEELSESFLKVNSRQTVRRTSKNQGKKMIRLKDADLSYGPPPIILPPEMKIAGETSRAFGRFIAFSKRHVISEPIVSEGIFYWLQDNSFSIELFKKKHNIPSIDLIYKKQEDGMYVLAYESEDFKKSYQEVKESYSKEREHRPGYSEKDLYEMYKDIITKSYRDEVKSIKQDEGLTCEFGDFKVFEPEVQSKPSLFNIGHAIQEAAVQGTKMAAADQFNEIAVDTCSLALKSLDVPDSVLQSEAYHKTAKVVAPMVTLSAAKYLGPVIPGHKTIAEGSKLAISVSSMDVFSKVFSKLRPKFQKLEELSKQLEVEPPTPHQLPEASKIEQPLIAEGVKEKQEV